MVWTPAGSKAFQTQRLHDIHLEDTLLVVCLTASVLTPTDTPIHHDHQFMLFLPNTSALRRHRAARLERCLRQVPHCHLSVFPPRRILFLGALPYFRSTLLLNTFKGKNYRKCLSSGQQPILESTMRKFFLINCIFCAKEFFCEISCNEK